MRSRTEATLWGLCGLVACTGPAAPSSSPPPPASPPVVAHMAPSLGTLTSLALRGRIVEETATERTTLPGMAPIYRAFTARDRPIAFLSGSPRFFA